jgi:phosphoglycolate phosphatase
MVTKQSRIALLMADGRSRVTIAHISGGDFPTELVIFDKDGTLIDFKETWIGIIDSLILAMGRHAPLTPTLKARVQDALGISVEKGEIDGCGPLAMGTFTECDALLTYCLYREGLRWDTAQAIVHSLDEEIFRSDIRKKNVKPAKGAIELLLRLKKKGIHIAVATNDKEEDARSDMESIGAGAYIDLVVGADSVSTSKPAPDMVMKICSHFGVAPDHAVLIGDTVMDAMLGRNSGVSLTIGIIGIVPREVLEQHMDVVVDSLDEIE